MNVLFGSTLSIDLFLFTSVENSHLFSSDWTNRNKSNSTVFGQFRGNLWNHPRSSQVYSRPHTCRHYIPITFPIKPRRIKCRFSFMENQKELKVSLLLILADIGTNKASYQSDVTYCFRGCFDLIFPQVTINSSENLSYVFVKK